LVHFVQFVTIVLPSPTLFLFLRSSFSPFGTLLFAISVLCRVASIVAWYVVPSKGLVLTSACSFRLLSDFLWLAAPPRFPLVFLLPYPILPREWSHCKWCHRPLDSPPGRTNVFLGRFLFVPPLWQGSFVRVRFGIPHGLQPYLLNLRLRSWF